jgi:hypothetical protein
VENHPGSEHQGREGRATSLEPEGTAKEQALPLGMGLVLLDPAGTATALRGSAGTATALRGLAGMARACSEQRPGTAKEQALPLGMGLVLLDPAGTATALRGSAGMATACSEQRPGTAKEQALPLGMGLVLRGSAGTATALRGLAGMARARPEPVQMMKALKLQDSQVAKGQGIQAVVPQALETEKERRASRGHRSGSPPPLDEGVPSDRRLAWRFRKSEVQHQDRKWELPLQLREPGKARPGPGPRRLAQRSLAPAPLERRPGLPQVPGQPEHQMPRQGRPMAQPLPESRPRAGPALLEAAAGSAHR